MAMATVSRHEDRLPVPARRHRSKPTDTAARARQQQETSNKVDYIEQIHARTNVQHSNSPVDTPPDHTQPTPSSRLSGQSLVREQVYTARAEAQSPSIKKSFGKPLATTDGERDAQTLPGVNQADPGEIANPMPGKNQPQPSIDAAAAALLFPDVQTSTLCKTVTTYLIMTTTHADAASTTSGSGMNAGFSWPTPTTSRTLPAVSSAPSLAPVPSFSTFVLFSRSEDIKEQVTTTISSSQSANAPFSLTTSPTLTAVSVPSTRPTPSNIASSAVGGSSTGLSPLSRSLFVLFGVLGAITMLIAVAVFYAARRNRKQQEQADRYIEDVPFENNKGIYDYGSKPRMSADTMHGLPPFLTESERNIVRRAATQDGQPEAHITVPGARLHDAINSFIAKSRRLTYKISP